MPDTMETNDAILELQKELEKLKNAATLLGEAREATLETINAAKQVADSTARLNERASDLASLTGELTKRIEGIDFPSRLEKLDATVSGINASVQNVIARVDSVERNMSSRIDSTQQAIIGRIDTQTVSINASIQGAIARIEGAEKNVVGKISQIGEVLAVARMEMNRGFKIVTYLAVGLVVLSLGIAVFLLSR